MIVKENGIDVFFNLIRFANDIELWEKRKKIIYNLVEEDLKRKKFIEKHLSENFKNLIPNKVTLDSMSQLIGYKLHNSYQSPNFQWTLKFIFTEHEIFEEKGFEFEVKLKDIATNCKVVNKNELKKIFQKLLYRTAYEIGYTLGMMERLELDIKILRNEREDLSINESIQDVQKVFYDFAVRKTEISDNYDLLFEFTGDIIKNNNIKFQKDFYGFIADIRERNINSRKKID